MTPNIITPDTWRYDNYFLPATDMEASRKFYGQTLGLKTKFDFPDKGMTAYRIGNEEPAIILKDIRRHPTARPTVWFEVADVEAIYHELKARGVRFITETFAIGTGHAAEFLDPSGNVLGLTDYIK